MIRVVMEARVVDLADIESLHELSIVEAIDRCFARCATRLAEELRTTEPTEQQLAGSQFPEELKARLVREQVRVADILAKQKWLSIDFASERTSWLDSQLSRLDYDALGRTLIGEARLLLQDVCDRKLIATGVLEPAGSSGFKRRIIPAEAFCIGQLVIHRKGSGTLEILSAKSTRSTTYSAVKIASPVAISATSMVQELAAPNATQFATRDASHVSVTPEAPSSPTATLAPRGPKERAADAAIKALQGQGLDLTTVSAKDLFPQVVKYCEKHGSSIPGFSTVEKAIARRRRA
jgi:hypothetical protein